MHAYCVGSLRFSEEAAFKRLHAARTARKHPLAFQLLGEGRLHMSAILLLASHLTEGNANELLAAAACKSSEAIRVLLAERFPRPEVALRIEAIPEQLASMPRAESGASPQCLTRFQHAPERVDSCARALVRPLSPGRFTLMLTMSQAMKDKLTRAKNLIAHRAPRADESQVLEEALDALIEKLEKRKYGATEKPRRGTRRTSGNSRHIPARVRRAVRARDQDRCTFVAENGHRCDERRMLEFNHIEPVARGGESTAGNLRLRCRAHNRYAAEQTYGAGFMQSKIEAARRAAARRQAEEVVPWLQALGIGAKEARAAAERADPSATLEERVKAALRCFGPRDVLFARAAPASP